MTETNSHNIEIWVENCQSVQHYDGWQKLNQLWWQNILKSNQSKNKSFEL